MIQQGNYVTCRTAHHSFHIPSTKSLVKGDDGIFKIVDVVPIKA